MRAETSKFARGAALVMVLMAVYAGTLFAQGTSAPSLAGSWDVTVTSRDCETGLVIPFIPIFPALMTFERDGTMQETDLGSPFLVRLPGHGVWARDAAPRQYSAAFRFLNFNPDTSFAGTNVIRSEITVKSSGNEYTSVDTLEVLDPAGHVVLTGCATSTARRFQ